MQNYEKDLNKSQFEAVSCDSQFTRVIAGAGSGKTRVLTYRIAYLMEKMNVYPSQILAITFTNKVAKGMKERVLKLLDENERIPLDIMTYHKFCAYFLRREISALDFPSNYVIIDEEDQEKILKDISVMHGSTRGDKFVNVVASFISHFKGQGKYPSDINPNTPDVRFPNFKQCLEYYQEYEAIKTANFGLDFDDLILKTIAILEYFPEIRERWSHYYRHILIDEFQDTNNIEYKLIKLLLNDETSLYVVGDPDQTIYTWRGANQDIIVKLDLDFPFLKDIYLKENYRSTKTILDSANELISHNKNRLPKDLIAINPHGNKVVCCGLSTRTQEAEWVVQQFITLKRLNPNFTFSDVAILYRSNYLAAPFESVLTRYKIPYIIYGGIRFYQRMEIKDCLAYFRLLINPNENLSFERIINSPKRNIGDKTLSILKAEAKMNNVSMFEFVKNLESYNSELKSKAIITLSSLVNLILKTKERFDSNEEALVAILEDYLDEVGYNSYLFTYDDGEERIQNVNALINEIKDFIKDGNCEMLSVFLDNASLQTSQDEIDEKDVVKLMTIHTAKGLEFKYVFVIGMNEYVFPSKRSVDERPIIGLEEERRLAYVAFTRAIKELFVTYNTDFSYVSSSSMLPSRFLYEAKILKKIEHNIFSDSSRIETAPTPKPKKNEAVYESFMKRLNTNTYKVGDLIHHVKNGNGTVIDIKNDIITVKFENGDVKKLLGTFPGITKLDDTSGEA